MNFRLLTNAIAPVLATMLAAPVMAQVDDGNFADNAHASYSSLFNIEFNAAPPFFEVGSRVTRASSTLVRNVNGISVTLSTSDLDPETAYTVWAEIFNNPEHCTASPCAFGPGGDAGIEEVNASVVWLTGGVSDAFGNADFDGHLVIGEPPPGQVLFGDGLVSRRAEIHLVVRSHGPAENLNAEELEQAQSSIGGGCAINACEDQQVAVHLP